MRSSWIPPLAAISLLAAAFALVRPGDGSGAGGPDYTSGILRLLAKESKRVPSAPFALDLTAAAAPVEPAAWGAVVVAADDRHPLTRAVALGLSERITEVGGVAIRDAAPEPNTPVPPVPLPADRLLTIAHLAGDPPATTNGAVDVRLRLTLRRVGPPDGHPALRLCRQPQVPETTAWEIRLAGTAQAQAEVLWAPWYAGFGRSAADRIIAALSGGAPPALKATHSAPWPSGALPQPPMAAGLRWGAAFADDLVRGFLGRIDGTVALKKDGGEEPAAAALIRLLGRGKWQPATAHASDQIWSREVAGRTDWCSLRADTGGSTVVFWQERPAAIAAVGAWLTEAGAGDPAAIARCRRLATVAYLPDDLRVRLAALP